MLEYVDFANKCKSNLEFLKTEKKNNAINGTYSRDWSTALIKLAENQVVIAEYMAQEVEEKRLRNERDRIEKSRFALRSDLESLTTLVIWVIVILLLIFTFTLFFV